MVESAPHQSLPAESPASESEKLIRCQAINPFGEAMVRFVDLEYFSLWEYMMTTRHHYRITDYGLCLWIPQDEYERAPQVYSHGRELEAVERFDIRIFDDVHHYTYSVSRFAPATEAQAYKEALLSHVPPEVRSGELFSLDQSSGYCIHTAHTRESDQFILGLYNALHH